MISQFLIQLVTTVDVIFWEYLKIPTINFVEFMTDVIYKFESWGL